MVRVSIIIPTLNEQRYLPILLKSIRGQSFSDYEIVVADAGSKDKTCSIARKFGCRIVPGGAPGEGRNNGAKNSKGSILLFIDCDLKLPSKLTLGRWVREFEKRRLGVATVRIRPLSNRLDDRIMHGMVNTYVRALDKAKPLAWGVIISRRNVFNKVRGFTTRNNLIEDSTFYFKACKHANHGVLRSDYAFVSVRRSQKEGRFVHIGKVVYIEYNRLLGKEIDPKKIRYEYSNFAE